MPRAVVVVLAAALVATACGRGHDHVIPWRATRPPATPIPPLAPPCRARTLRASLELQGATGSLVGGVVLRNVGPAACALVGRPGARFAGSRSRSTRWRVRALRPPAPELGALSLSPASLRAVRPGGEAWVQVFWSEWCPPGTRPGGAIGRRPEALVLSLPDGQGEIRLRPARSPRCDLPGTRSTLSVGPFVPRQREPSPGTRIPLRANMIGVPEDESKRRPPTLHSRRGGLLRYEIALTNTSRRTFHFARCPAYLEQLAPRGRAELYILNCRSAGAIAPGANATFAMVLRVPRAAPRGGNRLFWELAPTTYLPPSTAVRVVVE